MIVIMYRFQAVDNIVMSATIGIRLFSASLEVIFFSDILITFYHNLGRVSSPLCVCVCMNLDWCAVKHNCVTWVYLMTILSNYRMVVGCPLMHRPPLLPGNTPGTNFC